MKKPQIVICLLVSITFVIQSCRRDSGCYCTPAQIKTIPIRSADLSSLPQIESHGSKFYNFENIEKSPVEILKNQGLNTVRLRLWHSPTTNHSGFKEVKEFTKSLKGKGLRVWLSVHFSDTWADPGNQKTPAAWQGLSFSDLKDSVYNYTERVMLEIDPDYIQIGNEINNGFLFPHGDLGKEKDQFLELLEESVNAVRQVNSDSKIIMHFAGLEYSDWFFGLIEGLDYDYIGLSYYPWWHQKGLVALETTINSLGRSHHKKILIAETAYPFSLDWNDWTNNIVGDSTQLILPEFPATEDGQYYYMNQLKTMILYNYYTDGLSYWGGEMIAFDGSQSSSGSPWENCALFDFNNKALVAMQYLNP